MKTEYIVGIGEVLWDMLPEGRRLGGAPANFAYHVSQFGLNSVAVSAVGRDEAGDAVIRELNARAAQEGNTLKQPASVNASWDAPRDAPCESTSPGFRTMLSRVSFPTGTVGIRLDSSGVPQYDIRMPAAWDNIPFTPELQQLASRTRAVCFGTLARRSPVSRRTISDFVNAVPRGEGQWRILDINLRQHFYSRDIILEALEQCSSGKMPPAPPAVQPEVPDSYLRSAGQLRIFLHLRDTLIPRDPACESRRHRWRRRLIHSCFHRSPDPRTLPARSPPARRRRLRLRLHLQRGHARPARHPPRELGPVTMLSPSDWLLLPAIHDLLFPPPPSPSVCNLHSGISRCGSESCSIFLKTDWRGLWGICLPLSATEDAVVRIRSFSGI